MTLRYDYNLAKSFLSKVVLLGKMKRLAQRNKIKLITILFPLENLVQFGRNILPSGESPFLPTVDLE